MMDYEGFKKAVYDLTTIDLSSYKEKQMKRRIDALIKKSNFNSYDKYFEAISSNKQLRSEFLNYLTINVSEFYRNPDQWKILESEIFPRLLEKTRNLKIWSTACSTGDEPYTIAMVLNRFLPLSNIHVLATDIDIEALEKAREGVYTSKSIENLPPDYLRKYFVKQGDLYRISDDVKNCVEFKQHNLLKDEYPGNCDLIVCRNVLIYFTEEAKTDIYVKFNKSLKDDGILFVGSTEQIILSHKYRFKPVRTFFYVKEGNL